MAKKKEPDLDALGADYRSAKDSVDEHMKRWADAELAQVAWLKTHRGIPSNELYDRQTGAPLSPELLALEAAVVQGETDVKWCKALVVACGEAYKGQPFADVLNLTPREVEEIVAAKIQKQMAAERDAELREREAS